MSLTKQQMEAEGLFELLPQETLHERRTWERTIKAVIRREEINKIVAILRTYAKRAHITDSDRDAWESAIADVRRDP